MEKSSKYYYVVWLSSFFDRLWIGNPQRKILILILKKTKTLIKQKEKLRWFVYLLLKSQF